MEHSGWDQRDLKSVVKALTHFSLGINVFSGLPFPLSSDLKHWQDHSVLDHFPMIP